MTNVTLLASEWELIDRALVNFALATRDREVALHRQTMKLLNTVRSLTAPSTRPVHTDMDRNPTNFNLQAQIDSYGEAFRQECFLRRVSDNTVDSLARRVAELEKVASSLKETLNNPQVRGFTPS